LLGVELVPPGTGHVLYDADDKTLALKDTDSDDKAASPPPSNSHDVDPIMAVAGREGSRWVIDRAEKGSSTIEVKQSSAAGDFLRRLPIAANEPLPTAIAASLREDKIYLLEENDKAQRVRALTLVATKTEGTNVPVSEWKVDFQKSIIHHREFSIVDGKAIPLGGAKEEAASVPLKLQPNPLLNDDRVTVQLMVGFDGDGSFLKTADGLPLCTISETQDLRRALLDLHGKNTLDVFQDDGAVVEQFRVTGADQMMSFDCGGFELK
jgi:hypothetical protein